MNNITLLDRAGNIFDAPDNALLIHACNCQGSWEAGIAKAFKQLYPDAFNVYREHCLAYVLSNSSYILRGSSLLIRTVSRSGLVHYIGCLFTSNKYGRLKDECSMIIQNTKSSMELLMQHIIDIQDSIQISEIRMCKINSGYFSVSWKDTYQAIVSLNNIDNSTYLQIYVFSL